MPGPWTRASLAWVGILALAILNGAVREGLLVPRLGRTPGLVASGLLLSASAHFGTTIALRINPTIAGPSASDTSTEWPSIDVRCQMRRRWTRRQIEIANIAAVSADALQSSGDRYTSQREKRS